MRFSSACSFLIKRVLSKSKKSQLSELTHTHTYSMLYTNDIQYSLVVMFALGIFL